MLQVTILSWIIGIIAN